MVYYLEEIVLFSERIIKIRKSIGDGVNISGINIMNFLSQDLWLLFGALLSQPKHRSFQRNDIHKFKALTKKETFTIIYKILILVRKYR